MKTVLVGGKFNAIHPGHVWLLKKAREFGDYLVVVLAHDSHNKRSYAVPAKKRALQMAKSGLADEVRVGDEKDYFRIIRNVKPSVIVLGYDQELPPGLGDKISGLGIKVVRLKKHGNYSTKSMA